MLSAQREYEERKIKHYGILLANIATNKNINRPLANMLIRLAYQSSYHEFCILSLAEKRYMVSSPLGYRFPRRYGGIDLRAASIVLGVRNLAQQQLLEISSQQQDYFFMQPLGKTFSDLMGLDDVEKGDRDEIKQLLHEFEELAKAEDQAHASNSSFWPPDAA